MPAENSSFGMPTDSVLAQVYTEYAEAGFWVTAYDPQWRLIAWSVDLGATTNDIFIPNEFWFSPKRVDGQLHAAIGANTIESFREQFRLLGGWMLGDIAGGRDALRRMVHPELRDLVDALEPNDAHAVSRVEQTTAFGQGSRSVTYMRIHDDSGRFVGVLTLAKPGVPMRTLFMLAAAGDPGHFERMQRLATAGRRAAAILFADLEASSPLAKRLPTATYFTLVRRLTRAFDRCVVDLGGLVGRHAGDGVAAFFVAETAGSESAAARACIDAARMLQTAANEVAARHELPARELVVRAGLHWGATIYIGSIITVGRTEVTALGDEVNETARIESCATGGRLLSSKDLIERLDPEDAANLGIDADHLSYTPLAELGSATDKALRDAPAIPVCDIASWTA